MADLVIRTTDVRKFVSDTLKAINAGLWDADQKGVNYENPGEVTFTMVLVDENGFQALQEQGGDVTITDQADGGTSTETRTSTGRQENGSTRTSTEKQTGTEHVGTENAHNQESTEVRTFQDV